MRQHYIDWVKYILNSRDEKEVAKYVEFLINHRGILGTFQKIGVDSPPNPRYKGS